MSSHPLVFVGISGGVDSAVSAYLLKKNGYHVRGVFMKNWEAEDNAAFCPAAQDFSDAQKVCERIGIELEYVNFSDEYWQHVFSYFLSEYARGFTPNPDILCNKEIKFNAFLKYAETQGADFIATGHYARIENNQLLKGLDVTKDQSYFLYLLSQQQLNKSIFPIGHLLKTQVRSLAREIGFANHAKKDSTGICFIGERKFQQFLQEFLPANPGLIVTSDGQVVGEHAGIMFYTIGQRQGLKIGGKAGKKEAPWYVAAKDIAKNQLIVVQGEHPLLFKSSLIVTNLHWINTVSASKKIHAKIRYRQAEQPCCLEMLTQHTARVFFEEPQRAVTPGQAIVFYERDICLGGGIIELDVSS